MERGAHDREARERRLRIALPRDHRIGRGFLRIARPADSPAEPRDKPDLSKTRLFLAKQRPETKIAPGESRGAIGRP
jgi:hypothetical protein